MTTSTTTVEATLQPSARVRVYYNANHPADSTLSAGFYSMTLAIFFGGFAFVSLGAGISLTSFAVLSPVFVLLSIGLGSFPAFYFIIVGRAEFAQGIELVSQRPEKRSRRRDRV